MRKQILQDILELKGEILSLKHELDKYPWDSEAELVFLTREHIERALLKYKRGELTAQQLEYWANVIECREDIGFEQGYEVVIKDFLFQLANPLLSRSLK